jgi:POT family proton-dependent oligopeptide transporter
MLIGLIQFKLSEHMFGEIGLAPTKTEKTEGIREKENAPLTKIEKDRLIVVGVLAFFSIFFWAAFEQAGSSMTIFASENTDRALNGSAIITFKVISALLSALPVGILTWMFLGITKSIGKEYPTAMLFMALSILILWGIIGFMIYDQFYNANPEVPASWFQSLNALFIFTLAPLFSVIWEKLAKTKFNPTGPQKFSIGLILLGIGFIPMVIGSAGIGGNSVQKASMIFLTLAYLIHTMGELSLSPVGLSYVNKLSPKRLLGVMFGIWFFASAMGNKLAGSISSYMEEIAATSSMADFFNILVYIPIIGGVILFALSFPLKKLMHDIH